MSTYLATFETTAEGFSTVDQLLRDGFPPENLSLIADWRRETTGAGHKLASARLGDATDFVGRADDPEPSVAADVRHLISEVPHDLPDRLGGVDTSDTAFDVESVDQSDDSQEMAEDQTYPFRGISYGTREASEDVLEIETDFPTRPDARDDAFDTESPLEDQNIAGFEVISLSGRGTVGGGGALAAVALDLLGPAAEEASESIYRFLVDEGVPRPDAEGYRDAVVRGEVLLAVEIVPGRTKEERLEEIVEGHHGRMAQLYDGHRFNEMRAGRRDQS